MRVVAIVTDFDERAVRSRRLNANNLALLFSKPAVGQERPTQITVHWDKVIRTTQTTPTLQVVVNPPLQRGTPRT